MINVRHLHIMNAVINYRFEKRPRRTNKKESKKGEEEETPLRHRHTIELIITFRDHAGKFPEIFAYPKRRRRRGSDVVHGDDASPVFRKVVRKFSHFKVGFPAGSRRIWETCIPLLNLRNSIVRFYANKWRSLFIFQLFPGVKYLTARRLQSRKLFISTVAFTTFKSIS